LGLKRTLKPLWLLKVVLDIVAVKWPIREDLKHFKLPPSMISQVQWITNVNKLMMYANERCFNCYEELSRRLSGVLNTLY
jgi:hypothetical protein